MRRKDTDLLSVPESQYGSLTQDELLRIVVITRDKRSQRTKARKAWEMLIALDFDRVRGLVASFRFPGQSVRVHPNDVDDAVQYAFERLVKMLRTFKGTSQGEFRAAMRTCVRFACMDHCRAAMEDEKPIAGSLDEEAKDSEGKSKGGRFDSDLSHRERDRRQDEESLERALALEKRLVEAIAELSERKRIVIEMTLDGHTTEEIAARLETSHDNVYKLRERALKALHETLDGDGHP
jgi:RNA polymerase sigma factor (sigma-70 family)